MNCTTIPLQRHWTTRALDAIGQAWRSLRRRWTERRQMQDALDLDEATLRDMGLPLWMQEEARARREQRERGPSPDRLDARGGMGRFY